ncbi:MAG: hypothetical protein WCS77_06155 [Elusimicrobiaceae bacterium]|jgi:hypothetical protein
MKKMIIVALMTVFSSPMFAADTKTASQDQTATLMVQAFGKRDAAAFTKYLKEKNCHIVSVDNEKLKFFIGEKQQQPAMLMYDFLKSEAKANRSGEISPRRASRIGACREDDDCPGHGTYCVKLPGMQFGVCVPSQIPGLPF